MNWVELRTAILLFLMLTIPGWAFLSVFRIWHRWTALQRWIVAIAISISFYPLIFYGSRLFFPSFQIGERKLLALLILMVAVIIWRQRKVWPQQFAFERMDWIAIAVFLATLFTRLWVAHLRPYPAWSDSLHHTLLTQLVAQNGRLPYTLAPYEPSTLDMYHLGLYAISGSVELLSKVPAHTAVLWTSQFLNGLCGLGVFFVLSRMGSRVGSVIGAVVVGLLSLQPAWYVNWGRYTQVASQTILFITWMVTSEAMHYWRTAGRRFSVEGIGLILAASALNAGLFLIHFRVAGLYIPLLLISIIWQIYRAAKEGRQVKNLIPSLVLVGVISLLLILPALIPAMKVYIQESRATIQSGGPSLEYYDSPISALIGLTAQPWLIVVTAIALMIGLLTLDKIILAMLLWLVFTWLIGNAYRVGFFWLSFINYSGIVIMYYLPISVIIGQAAEILLQRVSHPLLKPIKSALIPIVLFLGFIGSHMRVNGQEEMRFFVTQPDLQAMAWIQDNTPQDATFAINTYNWLGTNPHGTDAGYWIPYFTGRKTNTGTMMFSYGPPDYVKWVNQTSDLVVNLDQDLRIGDLCRLKVQYAYIGKQGNPFQPDLNADRILQYPGTAVLYSKDGVIILKLCNDLK